MSGTVGTTDKTASYGAIVVSGLALAIFFAALGIAWWTKDSSLPILLGAAATNATTVISYWVGSSSGSKAKDSVIAQQASAPVPLSVLTTIGTNK